MSNTRQRNVLHFGYFVEEISQKIDKDLKIQYTYISKTNYRLDVLMKSYFSLHDRESIY